jgi:hypothetical protein
MKTPSKTIPTFTEKERSQHGELSDVIASTAAKYLENTDRLGVRDDHCRSASHTTFNHHQRHQS